MTTQFERPFPLIDIHTHLMPERLMQAVRAYMRANLWHPHYDGPTDELVPQLLGVGVDRFVFMPYAHRDGMAQSLNYWAANVQEAYAPYAIGFGTFHPDDGPMVPRLVDEAFGKLGLKGAKLHPQVGRFDLDDPRLYPLYERAIERGAVLSIHAGRRPEANQHVGARSFSRLMRRFPDLQVVVGHSGADEFDAFFDFCGEYPGVHLDTAMIFNQYLGGPPRVERVLEFQDRVVFGSNFPNIPFSVEATIRALRDLRLGPGIERKIFSTNAARLLGLDLAAIDPPEARELSTP